MLANMACSLIEHKRINTTLTKAKALKQFFEPLVTKSKVDSTHNRRIVFRYLRKKIAVSELFREISKKIADRPGGYTRVIRLGNRFGDNAEMAMIELVDFNETYSAEDKSKKKTRRRRKSKKNKDFIIDKHNEINAEEAPTEEASTEEAPTEEAPTEEASTEEALTEEAPTEEVPTEEVPTEEAPTEEAPTEEAPTEEVPTEEASSDNKEKGKNKESNNKREK